MRVKFLLQINFEEIIVLPPYNASSLNASDVTAFNMTEAFNITDVDIQFSQPVETAPVYLFCCALSLAAISAFLRAGFVLKFFAMICCIAVQGCVLSLSQLYAFYDHEMEGTRFVDLFMYFFACFDFISSLKYDLFLLLIFPCSHFNLATTGLFFLMLIAIVLHILDRQGDFVARTDFLWKAKLKTEQEEVETMRGINKVTFYDFHFFSINIVYAGRDDIGRKSGQFMHEPSPPLKISLI